MRNGLLDVKGEVLGGWSANPYLIGKVRFARNPGTIGEMWFWVPFSNDGASGRFPRPARQSVCRGRAGDQPHRSVAQYPQDDIRHRNCKHGSKPWRVGASTGTNFSRPYIDEFRL